MAISWNEIKDRALKFSNEWADETKERAEKDSFWNDFFNVFGISRRRVATFEEPVKKLSGNQGFIDLFWKGTLLVEHKSKGKNLDKAYEQATDYFPGLKEHELPKYILVSDFDKIKLFDLDERTEHEFHVSELYKNVKLFGFFAIVGLGITFLLNWVILKRLRFTQGYPMPMHIDGGCMCGDNFCQDVLFTFNVNIEDSLHNTTYHKKNI